jgi:hypothetical protein
MTEEAISPTPKADLCLPQFSVLPPGARVFPLPKGSKKPFKEFQWTTKASTDPQQIQAWSKEYGPCSWAMVVPDGYVCLDLDIGLDEDGFKALEQFAGYTREDMATCTHTTPSGGIHAFFRTSENFPPRRIAEGVDIRAAGKSYVVIPPSQGYVGSSGTTEIRALPEWIANVARAPSAAVEAIPKVEAEHPSARPAPSATSTTTARTTTGAEELPRVLDLIDADLRYDDWRDVIFSALNEWGTGEDTKAALRDWSETSPKFEEVAFNKVVKSHVPGHPHKLGRPTLHRTAAKHPRCTGKLPSVPTASETKARDLARRVLEGAIGMLKAHANDPSPGHEQSLKAVCDGLAFGIYSPDAFRLAFPLETGMGKTTCVIALIKELENTDTSLLVCAERVEQLEELRQELAKIHVGTSKVGILHSSRGPAYNHIKSVPVTDVGSVQFLLVSHARAKMDKGIVLSRELLNYNGRKRNLTIWDESLITTDACHIKVDLLERACHAWIGLYKRRALRDGERCRANHHLLAELHNFLEDFLNEIGVDGEINFAPLSTDAPEYHKPIEWLLNSNHDRECVKEVVRYGVLWGRARNVNVVNKSTLAQFVPTLSKEFDKVIVLDASARIRSLVRYDPSIKIFPVQLTKSFEKVTIHAGEAMASKSSFDTDREHLAHYIDEVKHIIYIRIPKGEPVLIFTHKELKEKISSALAAPGLNVKVLHWGAHRASNEFSNYKYVITVGVLYRDPQELAASIIGQTQRLDCPLNDSQIQHVQHSEMADMLYQAFSRGACRRTINGKAASQDIYLLLPEKELKPMLDILPLAMKDVKLPIYRPQYLPPSSKATRYIWIAGKIAEILRAQHPAVGTVSVQKIRLQVESMIGQKMSSNSKPWKNAVGHAADHVEGWHKVNNSFERVQASRTDPPIPTPNPQ